MQSKKQLEVALSKLKGFDQAQVRGEQYSTPSGIAAEVLWNAHMKDDIEGKYIADMGCGTGILGIGALLLGAEKVVFIDSDENALEICKENVEKSESESKAAFFHGDVSGFSENVDTVIMNPPFGTRIRHADRDFLLKAFELSPTIYSFHKTSTIDFLIEWAKKQQFLVEEHFHFDFLLKNTMEHHRKQKEYIRVSCLVFRR